MTTDDPFAPPSTPSAPDTPAWSVAVERAERRVWRRLVLSGVAALTCFALAPTVLSTVGRPTGLWVGMGLGLAGDVLAILAVRDFIRVAPGVEAVWYLVPATLGAGILSSVAILMASIVALVG